MQLAEDASGGVRSACRIPSGRPSVRGAVARDVIVIGVADVDLFLIGIVIVPLTVIVIVIIVRVLSGEKSTTAGDRASHRHPSSPVTPESPRAQ